MTFDSLPIPYVSASKKHWLLEGNSGGMTEHADGCINRHGPFQSSLNEGKHKRAKKPGILRGIGHMFRFGKHRKDGIAAVDTFDPNATINVTTLSTRSSNKENKSVVAANGINALGRGKPPNYQPPPPVAVGIPVAPNGIHQNDVFNHRYSHYVNYDELQQQIRYGSSIFNTFPLFISGKSSVDDLII